METSLCLNPQFMSTGRVGPQYCPSHFVPPPINGIHQSDPAFSFLPQLYREGCERVPANADVGTPHAAHGVTDVSRPCHRAG